MTQMTAINLAFPWSFFRLLFHKLNVIISHLFGIKTFANLHKEMRKWRDNLLTRGECCFLFKLFVGIHCFKQSQFLGRLWCEISEIWIEMRIFGMLMAYERFECVNIHNFKYNCFIKYTVCFGNFGRKHVKSGIIRFQSFPILLTNFQMIQNSSWNKVIKGNL